MSTSALQGIFDRYSASRENLMPLLQEILERDGYLSRESLDELSRYLGESVDEIYGVATFYSQFRFEPPGRHKVCVCTGTACHVRGANQILKDLVEELGIEEGQTTPDRRFSLESVRCLGACALAPLIVIDDDYLDDMTSAKARKQLNRYE